MFLKHGLFVHSTNLTEKCENDKKQILKIIKWLFLVSTIDFFYFNVLKLGAYALYFELLQ